MLREILIQSLSHTEAYFTRSTACLEEEHSTFTPREGMMNVAQQVAHVAQTIEWFFEGAFRPEGFDLDFEVHAAEIADLTSLEAARERLATAFADARAKLAECDDDELQAPLPDGPVMGGAPRMAIVSGIEDHTAHHRGALTVYARLQGLVPAMPYLDPPSPPGT